MRVTALIVGLIVLVGALPASPFYLRISAGYGWKSDCRFVDIDSSGRGPVPVFGESYHAAGTAGRSMAGEFAVGWRATRFLRLEAVAGWRPAVRFQGRANFPNAGDEQPVTADIRTWSAMAAAYIDLRPLFGGDDGGWQPYIGGAVGAARHTVKSLSMWFPQLNRPHDFTTPGGTHTALAVMINAGMALRLSRSLTLDLAWQSGDFGRMQTAAGEAVLFRPGENQRIPIPVAGTRADLHVEEVKLGLRWQW